MVIVFLLFLAGWIGVAYWFFQNQTFYRLFAFLMMSVLTYLSFELAVWSFRPPLYVMLGIGLIPIVFVAYGYRVYDYKRAEIKAKNDDKVKRDEVTES